MGHETGLDRWVGAGSCRFYPPKMVKTCVGADYPVKGQVSVKRVGTGPWNPSDEEERLSEPETGPRTGCKGRRTV